jgi:predicted TIM-barrel enzyme
VDAAIVGTWLHAGGQWAAPVDAERVRALVGLLRG